MEEANILIVEDEAIVAADIEDCLTNLGYRVCGIASTGETAVKKAEELHPDLALMDIRLKGNMDGIEAAIHMRESLDIPVVYLTAHADEATLSRAKISEPYGYILKPFEEIELRIALELALHKHKIMKRPEIEVPRGKDDSPTSEKLDVPVEFPPETTNVFNFLLRIEPFSDLPVRGLKMFAAGCYLRGFATGELIAFEGDPEVDGFLVVSGRLAMLKTSASGRELIVELLPPGDIFGLIASIDNRSYSYTAKAQAPTEVLRVPRSALLLLLEKYPELYRSFVEVISNRLQSSHNFSRALAHDRVEIRVASALIALVPHFSSVGQEREVYEIHLTRQELADLIGATVETAIRMTKSMERDELLDLADSGIIKILDLKKLKLLVEE